MAITIESNVPLPPQGKRGVGHYPWSGMEIGDSFFVPAADDEYQRRRANVSNAMSAYKLRHGSTYTARRVEGGIRIWRTA